MNAKTAWAEIGAGIWFIQFLFRLMLSMPFVLVGFLLVIMGSFISGIPLTLEKTK